MMQGRAGQTAGGGGAPAAGAEEQEDVEPE